MCVCVCVCIISKHIEIRGMHSKILLGGKFSGGPVIKGLPSNAGDMDVTSG